MCAVVSFGFVANAAADLVKKGDPEWAEIYQPAFTTPSEVPKGSKLRAQLFNQLRKTVPEKTRFHGSMKAYRNWAFFSGDSVDQKGKPLVAKGWISSDTCALWLRTASGWVLVDSSAGHSDAFFVIWPEKYGVPHELLGMPAKK